MSIFDVMGPVMIGPSSSHTAGAVKIGRIARMIFSDKIEKATIGLHGSFAKTYQGHGTDRALVCDPVAGLVEVPCVKRNGFAASHALTAANMALAGIESVIPPDEVIAAMKDIGDRLPDSLKETSEAGLAKTPTGKRYNNVENIKIND